MVRGGTFRIKVNKSVFSCYLFLSCAEQLSKRRNTWCTHHGKELPGFSRNPLGDDVYKRGKYDHRDQWTGFNT